MSVQNAYLLDDLYIESLLEVFNALAIDRPIYDFEHKRRYTIFTTLLLSPCLPSLISTLLGTNVT